MACSTKWKLQVYDAIIRNKLLYGLETVHLTQSLPKKVNVFQLRGLRKILGLSTTFINRANTNESVLQKANDVMGVAPGSMPKVKLFSDLLKDRRVKLAGHILRSYEPDSAETFRVAKRRIGGPRQLWTVYTNKYAWERTHRGVEFENDENHNHELLELARSRQF